MKKIFRVVLIFIFIFFSFISTTGFNYKSTVKLSLNIGLENILEKEFTENSEFRNFFQKMFNTRRSKLVLNFKQDGQTDREILYLMFPEMVSDIENMADEFDQPPIDATVKFMPYNKNKFVYNEGKIGKRILLDSIYHDIIKNIDQSKIKVLVKVDTIQPDLTVNKLKQKTVLRSSFKTYYGFSSESRKHNIKRALASINGTILEPDEQFSFNERVGCRTIARGYKEAIIIDNGKFVKGVGGGVCQVSSTLYDTALYSDLKIIYASKHSLPVGYIKASFDAMVTSVSDFIFKNNTSERLYIRAVADEQYVYISMYGLVMDYKIELFSHKLRDIPFETEYIDDENLEVGNEEIVKEGKNGLESKGYMRYIKNGKIVSERLIRHDIYAPQAKIIKRGTKEKEQPNIDTSPENLFDLPIIIKL